MDLSRYAALFLTESREQLASCNQLLLAWERDTANAEPVAGLFRAIHTIKGMAATMGYTHVTELAHRSENLLDALRHDRVAVSDDLVQLLFLAIDAIAAAVEAAADGRDGTVREETLLDALDRAAAEPAAPAPQAPGVPAAASAPQPAERLVRVTLRSGASMRGARALLALRRAEALGAVSQLRPPITHFERDDFDGRFSFRILSPTADPALIEAVQAAGDVESVSIEQIGSGSAVPERADGQRGGRQIRIDLARLDGLMKQTGELVVAKNRLLELAAGRQDPELDEIGSRIARLVSGIQSEVVLARMTPVGEVFDRFPRLVRDLGRELGKQIAFEVQGDEIELDRSILDEIGEPIMHLIRNAADHGLESPADRQAAGKPAAGKLVLSAARERNSVAIRVSDDGRGIDRARVLAKALSQGIVDPNVETLSDDQLLRILARPGFSTAAEVSEVSGRGVGIDAVLNRARSLGGTVELRTTEGRGTDWTLRVPLTLAIVRALLTRVGGERYAVPLAYVAETVELDRGALTAMRDREALVLRDQVIPTLRLEELVSVPSIPAAPRRPAVILEVGERRSALVVDALLGQQDIVVEPFEIPRGMPPFFGGATILADGIPALILDAAALV